MNALPTDPGNPHSIPCSLGLPSDDSLPPGPKRPPSPGGWRQGGGAGRLLSFPAPCATDRGKTPPPSYFPPEEAPQAPALHFSCIRLAINAIC